VNEAGFTGTREGMTPEQWARVHYMYIQLGIGALRHGDCIGSDAQAHMLAQHCSLRIIIHPPVDQTHRAFCQGAHETLPAKTHLARNRDIVDPVPILIATPLLMTPQDRGGTWYTIRYATKRSKFVYVVWPDGSMSTATPTSNTIW
jgi:hypothetical protein